MFGVDTAKLESGTGFGQRQVDPAAGQAGLEGPGGGGEVDQVQAVALAVFPDMRVAVNEGFDVLAGEEEVEEGLGVGQAGDFFGFHEDGIVVDEDERRITARV